MNQFKKTSVLLLASTLSFVIIGCGYDNDSKNIIGENLVVTPQTFKPILSLTQEQLQTGLLGIKSYKIEYMTTDESGKRVKASGLITIPNISKEFLTAYKQNKLPGLKNPNHNDFTLSIVSDQHGTIFENSQSPTKAISPTNPNKLAVAYSAKALFMTIQPDYIGYGDSNESHPYVLKKSLANATIDMIKASIAFANKAKLPINGQVFLSGYSEGGYATMAAAKEIQQNHPEIHLMAVAPMAGPYDLETMAVETLKSPIMAFPPFLAFIVNSYANAYSDIKIDDIINKPYASKLNTLFDGKHSAMQIYASLPNALDGNISKQATDRLFNPSYSDDLIANSDNKLRVHFRENSVIDWAPKMPMKLVQCTNDKIIPFAMNTLAVNSFKEHGSNLADVVSIQNIPDDPLDPTKVHSDCAVEAYKVVIPWFDAIRKGEK